MKFTLKLDLNPDTYVDRPHGEIARILRDVADRLTKDSGGTCLDINGKPCGEFTIIPGKRR